MPFFSTLIWIELKKKPTLNMIKSLWCFPGKTCLHFVHWHLVITEIYNLGYRLFIHNCILKIYKLKSSHIAVGLYLSYGENCSLKSKDFIACTTIPKLYFQSIDFFNKCTSCCRNIQKRKKKQSIHLPNFLQTIALSALHFPRAKMITSE